MTSAAEVTERLLNITNIHDVARKYIEATGDTTVTHVVTYRAQDNGRGGSGAAWVVSPIERGPGSPQRTVDLYRFYDFRDPRSTKERALAHAVKLTKDRELYVQITALRSRGYVPQRVADWFKTTRAAAVAAEKTSAGQGGDPN